jgi:WD40 repeat protein
VLAYGAGPRVFCIAVAEEPCVIATLEPHPVSERVVGVALGAGSTGASAATDGGVSLWDYRAGTVLARHAAHKREVSALAWSCDASALLSGQGGSTREKRKEEK